MFTFTKVTQTLDCLKVETEDRLFTKEEVLDTINKDSLSEDWDIQETITDTVIEVSMYNEFIDSYIIYKCQLVR